MALVLRELYKNYLYFSNEGRDTRLENSLLMGSPLKPLSIVLFYLYFVKSLGPRLMENRKPFELKNVLIVYNLFQVIVNCYLAGWGTVSLWGRDIRCLNVDYSPSGINEARISYCYYLLKVFDLLDTVFFILRKRYDQASFLHVYHHVGVSLGAFVSCSFLPGGHALGLGVLNCYVHALMYFYYFLSCIKSDLKSSIWWKKHITHIQMIQFAILFIHFGHPLVFGNCQYPKSWLVALCVQNMFMLILFSDFYHKAYIRKRQSKVN